MRGWSANTWGILIGLALRICRMRASFCQSASHWEEGKWGSGGT